MTDVARHRQDRRTAVKLDRGTLRLDPEPGTLAVDELYLQPPGRLLALEAARDGLAEQCAVGRLDEIHDVAPHELRGFEADQRGGRVVCQQDLLVVDQYDLGQRACEIAE